MANVHLGGGLYVDHLYLTSYSVNYRSVCFLLLKKIFFKFHKISSIVCSICLPNRHIITHCKHGNVPNLTRTLVYTSYTNICNRLFPNKFIINFSDLIYTSLLVASGTQTIDFVYIKFTCVNLLKQNLIKY